MLSRISIGASLAVIATALLGLSALADVPSPTKSVATVKATYELIGNGTYTSKDKTLNRKWTVKNTYTVTANMIAQAPSAFPAIHPQDAEQNTAQADAMATSNALRGDMASMIAHAEKIEGICGDDEACITRETMKMAQQADPKTVAKNAKAAKETKAPKMSQTRYQVFIGDGQTGSHSIAESMTVDAYDPGCYKEPNSRCLSEIVTTGAGPSTEGGSAKAGTQAASEVDLEKGSLRLTLPLPVTVVAKETINTRRPGNTSGTKDVKRRLDNLGLDLKVAQACASPCKTASGVKTFDVRDAQGEPAKLKVTWTFQRG